MHNPEISAYLTTWNSLAAGYPVEAAIRSLLTFASEVVVLDAGSSDGTFEHLERLHGEEWRVRLIREPLDVNHDSWALQYDLALKQHARASCHGSFLWQAEAYEVLTLDDARKVAYCTDYCNDDTPIVALPSYEYWGSTAWVRRDQYPATPKLSIHADWLCHGLPRGFQATDEHGMLYALPYVNLGASYVDARTGEPPTYDSVLDDEIDALRSNPQQLDRYEARFHDQLDDLPVVHNFTWVDIEEELRRMRDYWSRFDRSFYRSQEAISAWPFFEKNWADVSDPEIIVRSVELERDGPGVVSGERDIPTRMPARKELPELARPWLAGRNARHEAIPALT